MPSRLIGLPSLCFRTLCCANNWIVRSLVRWTPICSTRKEAVPHLQADLRAAIDPEEIRYQVAEVATAKLTGEAVGDAKRPLVARHPERRWQRRKDEVRLQRIDANVGVSSFGRRLRRRRRVLRADAAREEEDQTENRQCNPTKHPTLLNRKQSARDYYRKLTQK